MVNPVIMNSLETDLTSPLANVHSVISPDFKVVRLLGGVDGIDEEVDEPGERVLVHGLDVGQVCDGKEQD